MAIDRAEVDELWCLGDVVGYGADPEACTELVRARCKVCLAGNHDIAVLGELDISTFSETARAAVEWTRERASAATLEYLGGLQPAMKYAGIDLFHASPRDPIWEYVLSVEQAEAGFDAQDERIALIGHTHVALFFNRPEGARRGYSHGAQAGDGSALDVDSGAWLLNPGSVGQPRDGDPRAAWMELDTEELTARYHRAPYEIEKAAAAIREGGLPEPLAERLFVGR